MQQFSNGWKCAGSRRWFLGRMALATGAGGLASVARLGVGGVAAAAGGVSVIGDSLTSGVAGVLEQALIASGWSTAHVSAYPGRSVSSKMSGDRHTGLAAVDALRSSFGDSPAWVVALGTNDSGQVAGGRYEEQIDLMMDRIGGGHLVMWVDVALPSMSNRQRLWNEALQRVASRRSDEMAVHSWSDLALLHHEWFAEDQVHHTVTGGTARASAIAAATIPVFTSLSTATRVGSEEDPLSAVARTVAGRCTPIVPVRVFDTRRSGERFTGGSWTTVDLDAWVPADARAAAVNVTIVDPDGPGFVAAGSIRSAGIAGTSVLNHGAEWTTAGHAIVGLSSSRTFEVFASAGCDLVIDVQASFSPSGRLGMRGVQRERLIDTRANGSAAEPGERFRVVVPAGARVPSAAIVNLTLVDAATDGFAAVGDGGDGFPTTSNINAAVGHTVDNAAHVALDEDGAFMMVMHARAHLIVDLVATYDEDASAQLTLLGPVRVLDTRTGTGGWSGRLASGQELDVSLDAADAVVVGCITATRALHDGWLQAGAEPFTAYEGAPTSMLTVSTETNRSNLFCGTTDDRGRFWLRQGAGNGEHVIVDVTGMFT